MGLTLNEDTGEKILKLLAEPETRANAFHSAGQYPQELLHWVSLLKTSSAIETLEFSTEAG
jgi:hypothetical protein